MSNIHSSSYLKKIRVLTSLVKTLRGIYHIPNAPSRPTKDEAKQKAYDRRWATQPTKRTLHEALAAPAFEENRRFNRPADRVDAALKDVAPKSSVKY